MVHESATICGEIANIVERGASSNHQKSLEANAVNEITKKPTSTIDDASLTNLLHVSMIQAWHCRIQMNLASCVLQWILSMTNVLIVSCAYLPKTVASIIFLRMVMNPPIHHVWVWFQRKTEQRVQIPLRNFKCLNLENELYMHALERGNVSILNAIITSIYYYNINLLWALSTRVINKTDGRFDTRSGGI